MLIGTRKQGTLLSALLPFGNPTGGVNVSRNGLQMDMVFISSFLNKRLGVSGCGKKAARLSIHESLS